MAGRVSALAVLGLGPGADAAAIEQAYKNLIKQHHPDRPGGNAIRAAEITRAYRELRGGKAATDPLQFNKDIGAMRTARHWPLAALVAGGAIAALVVVMGPSVPLARSMSAPKVGLPFRHGARPSAAEAMAEPLHLAAIDSAVRQALRLYRTRDEMALADASNECHRRLRNDPGTAMLDQCAAFDDAVVGLEDRDPLRDEGPFAPLAVTGRQWSAASALSDDYLAIDGRLDQVRLRVELALAPQVPPIAPEVPPAEPSENAD
jgi:hypothetical protein